MGETRVAIFEAPAARLPGFEKSTCHLQLSTNFGQVMLDLDVRPELAAVVTLSQPHLRLFRWDELRAHRW